MSRTDKYTPTLLDDRRGLLVVNLSKCPTCGRWMLDNSAKNTREVFPTAMGDTLADQLKRADWRFTSGTTVGEDDVICEQCASEGRGSFTCQLCGQVRESSLVEERIGDPPEFLCKICYETSSAKAWNEKQDELYKAHRYDFE